jgi:DNA-binding transcriptional regulator YiaG
MTPQDQKWAKLNPNFSNNASETKPQKQYARISDIAIIRKNMGLTQRELAAMCGFYNHGNLGAYELGTQQPSVSMLRKLAKALDVAFVID